MHQSASPLNWVLGDYIMESVIRAGGRSTVYAARKRGETDLRALKVIAIGADPNARAIVEAERRGAELQQEFARHYGLVPWVEEIGETRSCLYVAMEFVPGEDLSDALMRGPIPSSRALEIAIELATFLERTHRFDVPGRAPERIIHADLKPGNVRLKPDGHLCVLDFGIAKAMAERRIETTQKWGTRQYMSPEWLHTGTIDEQVDYWSLGVVLYEMLAGYRPFRRFERHENQLEDAIRRRERPEALPPHVDLRLQQVVARLLAPEIRQRFASATEIRAALASCRPDLPTLPVSRAPDVPTEPIRLGIAATPAWSTTFVPPTARTASMVDSPPTEPFPGRVPPPPAAASGSPTAAALMPDVPTERVMPPALPPPLPSALPGDGATPRELVRNTAAFRARRAARRKLLAAGLWMVFAAILASEGIACIAAERLRADAAVAGQDDLDAALTRRAQLAGWTLFDAALHVRADPVLRDRLISLAELVLANYRQEQPTIGRLEWEQARTWLMHAVGLYPEERRLLAKLRYTEGHLQRLIGLRRAEGGQSRAARESYYAAVQRFREAAALDPQSPDPYLGLASTYVYGLGDVDNAVDALKGAEKRGYRMNRRERAQLGDGYRARGERIWRSARDLTGDQQRDAFDRAKKDFEQCVESFTPIVEFANAADQLHRCEARLTEIEEHKTPWWKRLFESSPDVDIEIPVPRPNGPR